VQLPAAQGGDSRCASGTIARFFCVKPPTSQCPSTGETDIMVDAGLVNVNELLDGNRGDQFLEDLPFGFVSFLITKALFLKVNLSCFSRFQIITPLTPKCLPIWTSV
jgi:hypothetical protein